jgi:hypothetical protein
MTLEASHTSFLENTNKKSNNNDNERVREKWRRYGEKK